MKLLLCARCNEVFSLALRIDRSCSAGCIGGRYVDNLNAEVWGDREALHVLGFANNTLHSALRDQMAHGDRSDGAGREFTAFVIPDSAPTVKRHT